MRKRRSVKILILITGMILVMSGCGKKEEVSENVPEEKIEYTDTLLLELYDTILCYEEYNYYALLDINDDGVKELFVTDLVDSYQEAYANGVDLYVLKDNVPVQIYDDLWSKYEPLSFDKVNSWIVCIGGGTGTSEYDIFYLDDSMVICTQKYSVTFEENNLGEEKETVYYNGINLDEETPDEFDDFWNSFTKMESEAIKFQQIVSDSVEEYVFPESDQRLLSEEELTGYDLQTLRLGRNEIFARHGYIFKSSDLQEYFENKSWYEGIVESEKFDENILNQFEKENVKLIKKIEESLQTELPTADSFDKISKYGFYGKNDEICDLIHESSEFISVLSFGTTGKILEETEKYYVVEADYYEPVRVPETISVGDSAEVILDVFTEESNMLHCIEKDSNTAWFTSDSGEEYWAYPSSTKEGYLEIYYESDDNLLKRVYSGELAILKNATDEINIINDIQTISTEALREGFWNCVVFNEKGYAERLIILGD